MRAYIKHCMLIVIMLSVFGIRQYADAQTSDAIGLENAFVAVAEEVGPAVVSISTEHIQERGRSYGRRGKFYEAFREDFFRDFMHAVPEKEYRRMGLGTGFIIDPAGYILTNEHVIGTADRITVTLPDGRDFVGSVVGADRRSDLAVIKIDADNLPVARLGDSDAVRIGEWSIAVGNPFGFAAINPEPTITTGVISALNRSLPRTSMRDRDYSDLIQTDAAINPGNSGGPLVNINGEIIGINVAILTTSGGYQGLGFAIPINTATFILDDLINGRTVVYGWLGVNIQDINQALADYFGLDDTNGVLVIRVIPNGPAELAGLGAGDIITHFNGERVNDPKDLIKMVSRTTVNTEVTVNLIRKGLHQSVPVTIAARPSADTASTVPAGQTDALAAWAGMKVQEITPEVIDHFGLSSEKGVIVMAVEPGSPCDRAGIRRGDILREIEQSAIGNLDDYARMTRRLSGAVLIRTDRGYVVVQAG